jgi:hypothetical protein
VSVVREGAHSVDTRTGQVFYTEERDAEGYVYVWECDEYGQPVRLFTRRYVPPPGTATEPRLSARPRAPRPVNMTGRQ